MLFAQSHWLLYNSGSAALFTSAMAYRFVLATEEDLFFVVTNEDALHCRHYFIH